ncbi:MAG TPA: hypothetical protein VME70_08990 [Mycobacteriales bacterium]|nr:hypothetical protein [Mycobacteriales bacterium]
MSAEETRHRAPKGRSPSYPGIPLYTAIERARTIYAREGKNPAPISAITRHWGYKTPTTGPASVTYAALKKFGLIEDTGNGAHRVATLTTLALDIILNNPGRPDAVQEAALAPPIHAEMWEKYGAELPSDDTLRWELVGQRNFTESGFREFIRVYRETIAWAQLTSKQRLSAKDQEPTDADTSTESNATLAAEDRGQLQDRRGGVSGATLTIPVPIVGGAPVIVEGQFPITEAAWDQFIAVLNAMKPGLVITPPTAVYISNGFMDEGYPASE